MVRLLVALGTTYTPDQLDVIRREADRDSRTPLFVGETKTSEVVSWDEFYRALGGEVPSWRALTSEYSSALLATSRNGYPTGLDTGEPWFIFESLVADGFEFLLGRRVRHLGGIRRGARVGDVLAQLPTGRILVIDAKAASSAFNAQGSALRPLGEYVERQFDRQRGDPPVHAAVIVSSGFRQSEDVLRENALGFGAEYGAPVVFVEASTLAHMIRTLTNLPLVRNSLRWNHLFKGGPLTIDAFDEEVEAVRSERIPEGP